MKKTLIALLSVSLASVAGAANINWTLSGAASRVVNGVSATSADATTAGNSSSAFTGTIYLLVADSASALGTDALGDNNTESAFLDKIGALKANDDYSTSDGKHPVVTSVPISSSLIKTSSQTYGLLVYDKDSYGNGWYKIVTATGTGYADNSPADAQTSVATSWNNIYSGSWNKAWEKPTDPDPGPTPGVPEPATGALALAGVALLFKRRRA